MATNTKPQPFKSRPRIRKDGFLTGRGIRVTNPNALPHRTARRTASLGMGGIEQYNRL
jgi:hypothetical protein